MNSVTIIHKLPKEKCITVKIFTDESGNKVTREVTYPITREEYIYRGRKSFRKIVTVT